MKAKVQAALEGVRPYLQADGGDLELLSVKDGIVTIRLTGRCVGCPASQKTLKDGIEKHLKEKLPNVKEVRQATDAPHAATATAIAEEKPKESLKAEPTENGSPRSGLPVTASLRKTHVKARDLLTRLDATLDAFESGAQTEEHIQTLREMREFLENDLHIHMHQEEEVLFPALIPFISWGSPMSRRAKEHQILNNEIKAFARTLADFERDGSMGRLVELGRQIAQRVRDDLYHEENILFMQADKALTGARADALREAMERIAAAAERKRKT